MTPDKIKKDFGDFIKNERDRQGLAQWQIADKVGISQVQLCHIENGNRRLDLPLALAICKVLRLDIRTFLDKYV